MASGAGWSDRLAMRKSISAQRPPRAVIHRPGSSGQSQIAPPSVETRSALHQIPGRPLAERMREPPEPVDPSRRAEGRRRAQTGRLPPEPPATKVGGGPGLRGPGRCPT